MTNTRHDMINVPCIIVHKKAFQYSLVSAFAVRCVYGITCKSLLLFLLQRRLVIREKQSNLNFSNM